MEDNGIKPKHKGYTFVKAVQATHHQVDVRYGTSRDTQCSWMPLMSVTWTLCRSSGMWDKFDLDGILDNEDQLFRLIDKFRYLRMEDLPQELIIENFSVNVKFLENNPREIEPWGILAIYCRN